MVKECFVGLQNVVKDEFCNISERLTAKRRKQLYCTCLVCIQEFLILLSTTKYIYQGVPINMGIELRLFVNDFLIL